MVVSNLQLRSGNQQDNASTLVIGECSHGFFSVLYILAINLMMQDKHDYQAHTVYTHANISRRTYTCKHIQLGQLYLAQCKSPGEKKQNKVPQSKWNCTIMLFFSGNCQHSESLPNMKQDPAVIMNGTVAVGRRGCCAHQSIRQRTYI